MAKLFLLLALVLLSLAALITSGVVEGATNPANFAAYGRSQYGTRQGSLRASQCPSACSNRCSATSKFKACMFFCNKCCSKCLCVPPGTYGNKEVCPCYNDWKTQQGGPKCP